MPVPPYPTARVPAKEIVPEVVIGPPVVVKPVEPPEIPTLVTVPVPAVLQEAFVPSVERTLLLFPDCEGRSALSAEV